MNRISGVLEGAAKLWPHNGMVVSFDPELDAAVLRALDNNRDPVYHRGEAEGFTEAMPQVRLIFVKDDRAPRPFLDALEAKQLPRLSGPCDRCLNDAQPVARLWLPAGGSIVQVECCSACRADLPGLVWR